PDPKLGHRLSATLRRCAQPGEIHFSLRRPQRLPVQLQLGLAGWTRKAIALERAWVDESGNRKLEDQRQWIGAKRLPFPGLCEYERGLPGRCGAHTAEHRSRGESGATRVARQLQ